MNTNTIKQTAGFTDKICITSTDDINEILSEAAKKITELAEVLFSSADNSDIDLVSLRVTWVNVPDPEHNPDGRYGAFRIQALGEPPSANVT